MTQSSTLWGTLQRFVPKRQWISTLEIFTIIECHSEFDRDDLQLYTSHMPHWKLNVRRMLRDKKKAGSVKGRALSGN